MPLGASIAATERLATLRAAADRELDLVVVGGGITGAGLARAAAGLGLRVALFEAADFASGTSSRSTKLIHGGLRYLAMGDIALVRETARERLEIHRRAPHLAEPIWMVLPTGSRIDLAKFRVGVSLYERLGAVAKDQRHENWAGDVLARHEPALDRAALRFACAYREYLTDDARLVLANLRSARARGALIVNHAPVTAISSDGGRATGVVVAAGDGGATVSVRARCIVNATGPWVERVRGLERRDPGSDSAAPWLHLSKGVHVAVPRTRLPVRNAVMLELADGRPIFVIPRDEVVYIGTTDTTYLHGPDLWPRIEPADVDYLLDPIPEFFSVEPLDRSDVVTAWAGLRPLIAEPGKAPSQLSRKDEVVVGETGVISIAGGKLTGYRQMAFDILDAIGRVLGSGLGRPDADADPLPGGDFDGDVDALARSLGAPDGIAARLARLYGAEAREVLARGPDPIARGVSIVDGEIDWAVREEGASTLEDLIYRRTRVALYSADPERALEPAADRLARLLSWSAERRAQEIARVAGRLRADLAFRDAGARPGVAVSAAFPS